MSFGDGLLYRAVAARIAAPPDEVNAVVRSRGTSLRYGRIGLPGLIWLASGGHPPAMPYVHPLLIVLAAGAAGAAAATLVPRAGVLGPSLPFLAPGFSLCIAGGYAEVLAAAFSLWAAVCVLRERWALAGMLLSAAMLTKENAGFVLIGVLLWALVRKQRGALLPLATSVVPVGIWYAIVAWRYGHIPPLDPYLRVATDTIGAPFVALARSIANPALAESLVATLLHVLLGLVALRMARRSLFGSVAAATGLQLLSAAPFAWRYIGDASRLFTFLQLFTVIALVARRRPMWFASEASPAPGRAV